MKKEGSVFGGMLLIAGSCIGSGMLGIPVITGFAGFFPSLLMFALAWAFMTSTGMILVEINGWFKGRTNFISMVAKTFGVGAKALCWVSYLLLFYSILVAYIALSGEHFSSLVSSFTSLYVPAIVSSILFVFLFGSLVLMGTKHVDFFNRWLMLFKIIAFCVLILAAFKFVSPSKLGYTQFPSIWISLPILVISFGFHNVIPSLTHYLGDDLKRVRLSILGGSLITFAVYVVWQVIALGILPIEGEHGIIASYKEGVDAAAALGSYTQNIIIDQSVKLFAFFAILTSFLAQTMTLSHFLGDGLKAKNKDSIGLVVLALIPPLLFEVLNPTVFYLALKFAGGVCAVILFGIMPVCMLWKGHYHLGHRVHLRLLAHKAILVIIALFSFFILVYTLFQLFI